ncbi:MULTISPECIES: hypothetical protein [Methylococcus]|jgi:hypothetical protein|uniref:Uncharacterized protein n=2 Tax=Methylococcus capsulatus TaxID=414 RepID=Q606I6_METCA|nr:MULTISPECIES: hypothetical protein [Methylococcus]AAU91725.1 hypothetical protein MCA2030 [Methylococcus capsulatus str. Bath]MDF9393149.1 hypothetical protein [Methylococcus capsulatus]QXP87347.1 hypothetical protein KW112_13435 [Methylococcus capsulatus]QXP91298.1 hypothetical protein KW114_03840 [Methylococcus capsulatus]QXP92912.1 hypothetical protein KW113_11085 [Methylococcus capsulatus]
MENQEKDNFWLWIGALIVGTVVLVVLFKARENEVSGWQSGAAQEAAKEVDAQIAKQKTK